MKKNEPISCLYQIGTFNGLMHGLYQANSSIKKIKKYANMGLGCGVGLGEIIGIDGNFYLADGQGNTTFLDDNKETPFLTAAYFEEPTISFLANNVDNLTDLQKLIDSKLPSNNISYAIKINGTFNSIEARSMDFAKPPYQPLLEWLKKHQHVFKEKDVDATMVAFKCPEFIKGIGVPGYHMHYIRNDKTRGGHVFGLSIKTAEIEIQPLYNVSIKLPNRKEYLSANISYDDKTNNQMEKIAFNK